MGINGKNIVTKVSIQICKLLMGIIEQYDAVIAHRVLISELGDDGAKFLLKENFLTKGHNLEHYWDGDDDKWVDWYDHLNSFAYLSLSGLIKVSEDDLKTYNINFSRIMDFLATELDVFESSRVKQNQYLEGSLYFVGNAQIHKRKVAIFFARRLNDHEVFEQIEEFFIKESVTSLPKLILTSSIQFYPKSLQASKVKIISIPKILDLSTNNKILFNIDYINNVLFGSGSNESKPHIYCSQDGSVLFIGDKDWNIKGDKQRQIIKIMCDSYAQNSNAKQRWNTILAVADIETSASPRNFFKGSTVINAINYGKGFVWFNDAENS